jgi:tight adherence protein B
MQSALDAQLDRIMVADEIKSQLAGPKTAAVTLAMLPIATLLLAQSLGIAAISWLLTSPIGLISLTIGGLLLGTGTWVMFRLAKNIEQELQL